MRTVAEKPHDAIVKFNNTCRNVQRHRAVLPAIARHLVTITHLHLVVGLAVFNPDLALALRVYKQWKARRLGDNKTVLNGQLVTWQTLQIPFTYC